MLQFGDSLDGDALKGAIVSINGEYSGDAVKWYTRLFGLEGNVQLTWHPSMHAPGDSELVLTSPANMGSGFMSMCATTQAFSNRTVSELAQKDPNWSFIVHGTPIRTLFSI